MNPKHVNHNPVEWGKPMDQAFVSELSEAMFVDSTDPEPGEVILFNTTTEECLAMSESEMYRRGCWYLSGNHTSEAMSLNNGQLDMEAP